jgi:4-hydroxybenzoate polyprenyltransferase
LRNAITFKKKGVLSAGKPKLPQVLAYAITLLLIELLLSAQAHLPQVLAYAGSVVSAWVYTNLPLGLGNQRRLHMSSPKYLISA